MKHIITFSAITLGFLAASHSVSGQKNQPNCPGGATWCSQIGSCIPSGESCPPNVVVVDVRKDAINSLPANTRFICEGGVSPTKTITAVPLPGFPTEIWSCPAVIRSPGASKP